MTFNEIKKIYSQITEPTHFVDEGEGMDEYTSYLNVDGYMFVFSWRSKQSADSQSAEMVSVCKYEQ